MKKDHELMAAANPRCGSVGYIDIAIPYPIRARDVVNSMKWMRDRIVYVNWKKQPLVGSSIGCEAGISAVLLFDLNGFIISKSFFDD